MIPGAVKIEGVGVLPAQTEGRADVYSDNNYILAKSKWMPDDEATHCPLCQQKFSQLRRKHHCRQCGQVFCSKCCKTNVPLPQLGLENPERVCDGCLPVVELVTKSKSPQGSFQSESIQGLLEQIHDSTGLRKVVQLGGVQAIISLSRSSNSEVRKKCAEALHLLAMQEPLHNMLIDAGAIKALCGLLMSASETDEQLLSYLIGALMIFAKAPHLQMRVVQDGALPPVLALCGMNVSEAIALIAVRTLNLLMENIGSHTALIESDRNALPRLLKLTVSMDEQMQEVSLKTLSRLSMGTDYHRHRIVQEDFSAGKCLMKSLQCHPKNLQVLCNAACLVANLATSEQDQSSLTECLDALCSLLTKFKEQVDLLVHVIRGLANFASFHQNVYRLEQHLPSIITICLKGSIEYIVCNPWKLSSLRQSPKLSKKDTPSQVAVCMQPIDVLLLKSLKGDYTINVRKKVSNATYMSRGNLAKAMGDHIQGPTDFELFVVYLHKYKSTNEAVQQHSLRLILHVLHRSSEQAITALMRDGGADLLRSIAKTPGMVDAMQANLRQYVSALSAPS